MWENAPVGPREPCSFQVWMEKETMDMSFLGVLLNLDGIILIRILEEPENSLKVLDFLGFIPRQMFIPLGLKQNLQGFRKLQEADWGVGEETGLNQAQSQRMRRKAKIN